MACPLRILARPIPTDLNRRFPMLSRLMEFWRDDSGSLTTDFGLLAGAIVAALGVLSVSDLTSQHPIRQTLKKICAYFS